MIETYLLEHLAAFRKAGTLSEAAEQLHLTQPTLTRSMNKLEELFGVPLFTREKKRLYLNESGRLAAQYAEDILVMQDNMVNQVRSLDRLSRTITVGYVAPGPIMELMPVLTSTFALMTVSAELADEEALIRGLNDKTYQMIILTHLINEDKYYSQHCASEHLCAALPPIHKYYANKSVTFGELDGDSFLMANEVGIWEDLVRAKMPSSKFFLQEGTDSLMAVMQSSTLPSFATDITIRVLGGRGDRAIVPFSDSEASMNFYCICLTSERSKYKNWFRTLNRREV